jgi:hypothetical protein
MLKLAFFHSFRNAIHLEVLFQFVRIADGAVFQFANRALPDEFGEVILETVSNGYVGSLGIITQFAIWLYRRVQDRNANTKGPSFWRLPIKGPISLAPREYLAYAIIHTLEHSYPGPQPRISMQDWCP